jgi:2-iminobutanoate/2-iminopropanoate deaminase
MSSLLASHTLPPEGHIMQITAVTTARAPAALGPYSQAVVAGGLVFCSGTAGIDPDTGIVADGIEAQTEQALRNLAAILEEAGSSLRDVVKTTIFYADVDDFALLNAVYARHMPDPPPARRRPPTSSCLEACWSRSKPSPWSRGPRAPLLPATRGHIRHVTL